MPRKLDKYAALQECKKIHSGVYDYSLSVIGKATSKIKIICPKHGVFEQRLDHHRGGSGCQKCRSDKMRAAQSYSAEDFIKKAGTAHGCGYDYSLVVYENGNSKIKIICPKHGIFEQRAKNHLAGRGCPECGRGKVSDAKRSNFDSFTKSAIAVHGDKYEYPEQAYKTGHTKVRIICPIHGEFFQTPANHLNGRGCASCGRYGFRDDIEAVLYVLRSDCTRYVKIGITGNLELRIEQLKRSTPFGFKTAFTFDMPGKAARPMEAYAHRQSTNAGFTDFNGATEWQHADDQALDRVVKMCSGGRVA